MKFVITCSIWSGTPCRPLSRWTNNQRSGGTCDPVSSTFWSRFISPFAFAQKPSISPSTSWTDMFHAASFISSTTSSLAVLPSGSPLSLKMRKSESQRCRILFKSAARHTKSLLSFRWKVMFFRQYNGLLDILPPKHG